MLPFEPFGSLKSNKEDVLLLPAYCVCLYGCIDKLVVRSANECSGSVPV